MHIMSFSERMYFHVPEDHIINNQNSYFGIPNKYFDPQKGGQLMNEYLDERIYAEEMGFDGVMLNEHHQTRHCNRAEEQQQHQRDRESSGTHQFQSSADRTRQACRDTRKNDQ